MRVMTALTPSASPFGEGSAYPSPRWRWTVGALQHRRGFSLPEAIVVLVLIGLVVGVGFPRVFGTRERLGVKSASDRFAQAYALTRSTAARFGSIAELRIDPAGSRFWIQVRRDSGVMDTVRMIDDLERGIRLTADQTVLCFDARGLPTSVGDCEPPGGRVEFRKSSSTESLRITPLGKILR